MSGAHGREQLLRANFEDQDPEKVAAAKIFKLKWDEAKLNQKYIQLKLKFKQFMKEIDIATNKKNSH